jgi:LysM repeat protein
MGNWSFARVLAPLALIAAVVGVFVVVQTARPKADGDSSAARTTQTTRQQRRGGRARRRIYVVRAGDNLTLIAERTGVPLERIERLNPDLDTQTLSVGQRLRLTR